MAAAVTKVLYGHGCAIGDSNMMLLDNEFTITLIMTLPKRKGPATVEKDLKKLEKSKDIAVNLKELPPQRGGQSPPGNLMVTLHGENRPGIIYRFSELLCKLGVDITNLESKSVAGAKKGLYVVVIEAVLDRHDALKKVEGRLKTLARSLGMKISVMEIEAHNPL